MIGLLWMDHQYGGWGSHVTWGWTGTQLDNGVSIMAFTTAPNAADKPQPGIGTILMPDGAEFFEPVTMTPRNPTLTEREDRKCLFHQVDARHPRPQRLPDHHQRARRAGIPHPRVAKLNNSSVYEAVSTVSGTWDGKPIAGQSWNEQAD